MKLIYEENKALPPLGWCAAIKDGTAHIVHGVQVETNPHFFVDGAWDGDFASGNFVDAEWFCGTGAALLDGKIVFSTPTHVTAGLYMANMESGYLVSNSLHFLLVRAGRKLDPSYKYYKRDFNTIIAGIHQYKAEIHTIPDGEHAQPPASACTSVTMLFFRNLSIDDNNAIAISIKPCVSPFSSYENYRDRLVAAMERMAQNAAYAGRKQTYGMVTTISKGYDSPACAAVAKQVGCDRAVTFCAKGKYAQDSGVEIAKKLGYINIIERDAMSFQNRTDCVEAMYICSGDLGASISSSVFDKDYAGCLVFTGDRGDSLWSPDSAHRNCEFRFIDILSHLGNGERRLWTGYIAVPMPLYGATAWPSLYTISNAKEMEPWRLGNDYDRPIARRLVEEAGVPRDWFGMEKHGGGFYYQYDWMKRLLSRMSKASAKSFFSYVQRNKKRQIRWMGELLVWLFYTWPVYWNAAFGKIKRVKIDVEKQNKAANPMAVRYLIPWASEVVCLKYRAALAKKEL